VIKTKNPHPHHSHIVLIKKRLIAKDLQARRTAHIEKPKGYVWFDSFMGVTSDHIHWLVARSIEKDAYEHAVKIISKGDSHDTRNEQRNHALPVDILDVAIAEAHAHLRAVMHMDADLEGSSAKRAGG
jgi:hypothetical protein